jgi:ADP-ribosylglycohydrolase
VVLEVAKSFIGRFLELEGLFKQRQVGVILGAFDKALAGSADPQSAGNGSLMRLAPVPMFFAADPEKAVMMSAESSKTTHGTVACLDACRYF